MAKPVEVKEASGRVALPVTGAQSLEWPREGRAAGAERWIARILRAGVLISGGMFMASLVMEALPRSLEAHVMIDTLRKGAASVLLVTPVARLVIAGAALGLRGEYRYTLYAAGVLGLIALAVSAGLQA